MATENVYELHSDEKHSCINAMSGYSRPSDDKYPQPSDVPEYNNATSEPACASPGNLAFEHFDDPIGVVNSQQSRARMSVPQTQDKPADVPMCRQPKSWWPVMTVILLSSVALGLVILGVNVHLQLESLVSYSRFTFLKRRLIITIIR